MLSAHMSNDDIYDYIDDHLPDMVHGYIIEKKLDVLVEDFIESLTSDSEFYQWALRQVKEYAEPDDTE